MDWSLGAKAQSRMLSVASGRWQNTLAIEGDSFNEYNGKPSTQGIYAAFRDTGWYIWAQLELGNELQLVYNGSVGGSKISDVIARLPQALAHRTRFLDLHFGTNDFKATAASEMLRLAEIAYETTLANGTIPVAHTIAPRSNLTVAEALNLYAYNDGLRQLCRRNGNILLVDDFDDIADPMTNAAPKAGYLQADGLHPTPRFARLRGKKWASVVGPYMGPKLAVHTRTPLDNRTGNPSLSNQLLPNPFMQKTGVDGFLLPANTVPTAGIATGWSAGHIVGAPTTVTPSLEARSDGFGFNQVLDTACSGSTQYKIITPNTGLAGLYSPGDWVELEFYVSMSNMANVLHSILSIDILNPTSYKAEAFAAFAASPAEYDQTAWEGWVKTPLIKIPTGALTQFRASLFVQNQGAGSAKMKLGVGGLRNYGQTAPF